MTIKSKLTAIMMVTSAVAVLVSCIVFIIFSLMQYHQFHLRELAILTDVIGHNCQAALKFDIPEDAEKVLSSLDADPSVIFACIYDTQGNVFASYRDQATPNIIEPPKLRPAGNYFEKGFLKLFDSIDMGGETIGYIYFHDDAREMTSVVRNTIITLIAVILLAMLIAYWIAAKLQAFISKPILALSKTASMITEQNDYSVRAYKHAEDEVGLLIDSFNTMLTHIEQATEERERLLKTLASKNEELESIVFISSHDLRSPLVNIQGFSGELGYSCKEIGTLIDQTDVSPEIKGRISAILRDDIGLSLEYIANSTNRMDMLIKGLLKLSRLGRAAMDVKTLDMNKIVSEILDTMRYQIAKKNVEVQIYDLPKCYGDESQINQVFSNLLSNAIKYFDDSRPGKISISGCSNGDRSVYCVQDNGVGIAAKYFNVIFDIFHRLDPTKSASGEGLGLTIVKRIIDRHSGKIWVESDVGAGSRFYVDLPAAETD
jgi:signal transduction histidine kinase